MLYSNRHSRSLALSRTSRIRLSIAVLSIPCYFIDGRIHYPVTAGGLRCYRVTLKVSYNADFFGFNLLNVLGAAAAALGMRALVSKPLLRMSF